MNDDIFQKLKGETDDLVDASNENKKGRKKNKERNVNKKVLSIVLIVVIVLAGGIFIIGKLVFFRDAYALYFKAMNSYSGYLFTFEEEDVGNGQTAAKYYNVDIEGDSGSGYYKIDNYKAVSSLFTNDLDLIEALNIVPLNGEYYINESLVPRCDESYYVKSELVKQSWNKYTAIDYYCLNENGICSDTEYITYTNAFAFDLFGKITEYTYNGWCPF